ncbi:hypothetical protein F5B19DRAFT_505631 [Rostrohypoxylon terebratum]|nr:hypothetical protein F5B19DRAFT_505631 [Rostrohypoxylon terebratum]
MKLHMVITAPGGNVSAFGGKSVHGKGFANTMRKRIIPSGASLTWFDGSEKSTEYTASAELGADLKAELDPIYYPGYPVSNSGANSRTISVKSKCLQLELVFAGFLDSLHRANPLGRKYLASTLTLTQSRPNTYSNIYEANWNENLWIYPSVEGENGYLGPAASWNGIPNCYSDPSINNPNVPVERHVARGLEPLEPLIVRAAG